MKTLVFFLLFFFTTRLHAALQADQACKKIINVKIIATWSAAIDSLPSPLSSISKVERVLKNGSITAYKTTEFSNGNGRP